MALMRATEAFFDSSSGTEVFVGYGEVLEDTHPLVKAHSDLFAPVAASQLHEPPAKAEPKRAAVK